MKVRVGDRAPDATVIDTTGEPVTLSSFFGKGPVVLYFYPHDYTVTCTREACGFRDESEEIGKLGGRIVGISRDPPDSHQRFIDDHMLPFPLLTDRGGQARRAYGVSRAFGLVDGRTTFVIDRQGVVQARIDGLLSAKKHVQGALAALRSLAMAGRRA